jgi:hypothetical protein
MNDRAMQYLGEATQVNRGSNPNMGQVSKGIQEAGERLSRAAQGWGEKQDGAIKPGELQFWYDVEGASPQAIRVVEHIHQAVRVFLEKNKGYGNTAYELGARGQYADMNRKFGKLKHTLWDGNDSVGESEEEMLQDLIGHCGLTIDYIQEGIR